MPSTLRRNGAVPINCRTSQPPCVSIRILGIQKPDAWRLMRHPSRRHWTECSGDIQSRLSAAPIGHFDGLQQPQGFVQGFLILTLWITIGDNAGAGLDIGDAIVNHDSA